jgi:hypothetical protein
MPEPFTKDSALAFASVQALAAPFFTGALVAFFDLVATVFRVLVSSVLVAGVDSGCAWAGSAGAGGLTGAVPAASAFTASYALWASFSAAASGSVAGGAALRVTNCRT